MTRLTVAGMLLAVSALGCLALWSALVTQNEARALNRAGVQITGQLRAVQSLYVVRTETDELEDDFTGERLERLRAAVQALPQELSRMQWGDSPEAVRVAAAAMPLAARLGPAVERFLADPRSDINFRGDEGGDDAAEDAMEEIVEDLEGLLNDSESDPAVQLAGKLDTVNEAGATVRRTAAVLIPLGLGGVIGCAWLLRVYRRRSEVAMQEALDATARDARTDQLTGLPNRRAVLEELNRRVAGGESFTFAMADLNGFKHYNDSFGHPAGDALLRRLGDRLAGAWRGHGYAARLGGDEFCVIAEKLGDDELQSILHAALSEEGVGYSISAESGLARVPAEAADSSSALSLADTRLYDAKAQFHGVNPHRR